MGRPSARSRSRADAVDRALETAYRLFRDRRGWLPPLRRIEILSGIASRMEQEAEDLAVLAAREGGKPLVDSRVEVARAIDGVRNCCELLRSEGGARRADERQRRLGRPDRLHATRADRRRRRAQRLQPSAEPDRAPGRAGDRRRLPGDRQAGRRHAALLLPLRRDAARGRPAGGLVPGARSREQRLAGELAADPRVGFLSFIGSARVGWSLRSGSRRAPAARSSTAARRR